MMPSPELVTTAAVSICSVAAAAIDLRTRRVPNGLTGGAAVFGLALALTGAGRIGLIAAVVGGVLGLTLMLPGYLFGATGGGDVKLLAALGTLLGPQGIVFAYFGMAIGGGLIALAIAAYRGQLRNQMFAYAPAIAIGAIFAVLK
jgi:prepilin peptidase CpaA